MQISVGNTSDLNKLKSLFSDGKKKRRFTDFNDLGLLLSNFTKENNSHSCNQESVGESGLNAKQYAPVKRVCGSCRLCCIHLQIDSEPGFSTLADNDGVNIAKKAGQPCKFLGSSGCRVYARRPKVCRQFACDWLNEKEDFKFDESPLNIGVIGVGGVNLILNPGD